MLPAGMISLLLFLRPNRKDLDSLKKEIGDKTTQIYSPLRISSIAKSVKET
jgi:hypothetical protein